MLRLLQRLRRSELRRRRARRGRLGRLRLLLGRRGLRGRGARCRGRSFGRLLLLLRRRGCSWGLKVFGFAGRGDSVHVIVVVRWRCEGGVPGFSAREESRRLGLRLVDVSPGRARAQMALPRMIGQRVCPPRVNEVSGRQAGTDCSHATGAGAVRCARRGWADDDEKSQRGLRTAGRDRLQPRNERGSRTVCAARLGR